MSGQGQPSFEVARWSQSRRDPRSTGCRAWQAAGVARGSRSGSLEAWGGSTNGALVLLVGWLAALSPSRGEGFWAAAAACPAQPSAMEWGKTGGGLVEERGGNEGKARVRKYQPTGRRHSTSAVQQQQQQQETRRQQETLRVCVPTLPSQRACGLVVVVGWCDEARRGQATITP